MNSPSNHPQCAPPIRLPYLLFFYLFFPPPRGAHFTVFRAQHRSARLNFQGSPAPLPFGRLSPVSYLHIAQLLLFAYTRARVSSFPGEFNLLDPADPAFAVMCILYSRRRRLCWCVNVRVFKSSRVVSVFFFFCVRYVSFWAEVITR